MCLNFCDIDVEGKRLTVDLVPLVTKYFKKGMDWLSVNHDIIDCENKG